MPNLNADCFSTNFKGESGKVASAHTHSTVQDQHMLKKFKVFKIRFELERYKIGELINKLNPELSG